MTHTHDVDNPVVNETGEVCTNESHYKAMPKFSKVESGQYEGLRVVTPQQVHDDELHQGDEEDPQDVTAGTNDSPAKKTLKKK